MTATEEVLVSRAEKERRPDGNSRGTVFRPGARPRHVDTDPLYDALKPSHSVGLPSRAIGTYGTEKDIARLFELVVDWSGDRRPEALHDIAFLLDAITYIGGWDAFKALRRVLLFCDDWAVRRMTIGFMRQLIVGEPASADMDPELDAARLDQLRRSFELLDEEEQQVALRGLDRLASELVEDLLESVPTPAPISSYSVRELEGLITTLIQEISDPVTAAVHVLRRLDPDNRKEAIKRAAAC